MIALMLPSINGTVDQASMWSAPSHQVSGGTDRFLLVVEWLKVHSVQQRDGQPDQFMFSPWRRSVGRNRLVCVGGR